MKAIKGARGRATLITFHQQPESTWGEVKNERPLM